jgi:hypothetical protein
MNNRQPSSYLVKVYVIVLWLLVGSTIAAAQNENEHLHSNGSLDLKDVRQGPFRPPSGSTMAASSFSITGGRFVKELSRS